MSTSTSLNFPLANQHNSANRIEAAIAAGLIAILISGSSSTKAVGQEQVTIRGELGSMIRTGTIVNFDARELKLRLPRGSATTIPSARVEKIRYKKSPTHLAGDSAFANGEFTTALNHYLNAQTEADRYWVQEEMLIGAVRCYHNENRILEASEVFLTILDKNPRCRHVNAIPITWRPRAAPRRLAQRAKQWLDSKDAIEPRKLIGASWLLSGPQRSTALKELGRLRTSKTAWIRQLATAQLWRTQAVKAQSGQADQWWRELQKFPTEIAGGPSFVLAQVQQRHEQTDDATLSYLRAAFAPELRADVQQEALAAAIGILEANHPEEAERLKRELRRGEAEILIQ